jgi:hypothetical protein
MALASRMSAPDSGIVITPLDGGSKKDAGTPEEDGGATMTMPDGGSETPDAGGGTMTPGHCGCASSDAVSLLAVALVATRRRRSP